MDLNMLLNILMFISSAIGLGCGLYLFRKGKPQHRLPSSKNRIKVPEITVIHTKKAKQTKKEKEKASPSAQGLTEIGDKLAKFMEEKH